MGGGAIPPLAGTAPGTASSFPPVPRLAPARNAIAHSSVSPMSFLVTQASAVAYLIRGFDEKYAKVDDEEYDMVNTPQQHDACRARSRVHHRLPAYWRGPPPREHAPEDGAPEEEPARMPVTVRSGHRAWRRGIRTHEPRSPAARA